LLFLIPFFFLHLLVFISLRLQALTILVFLFLTFLLPLLLVFLILIIFEGVPPLQLSFSPLITLIFQFLFIFSIFLGHFWYSIKRKIIYFLLQQLRHPLILREICYSYLYLIFSKFSHLLLLNYRKLLIFFLVFIHLYFAYTSNPLNSYKSISFII